MQTCHKCPNTEFIERGLCYTCRTNQDAGYRNQKRIRKFWPAMLLKAKIEAKNDSWTDASIQRFKNVVVPTGQVYVATSNNLVMGGGSTRVITGNYYRFVIKDPTKPFTPDNAKIIHRLFENNVIMNTHEYDPAIPAESDDSEDEEEEDEDRTAKCIKKFDKRIKKFISRQRMEAEEYIHDQCKKLKHSLL